MAAAHSGEFVVGVDVGTGSARAGVFSARDGVRLGLAVHPILLWRPQAGYAEQSSADIWNAVGQVVRAAVSQAGIDPAQVVGVGFDATCSLVALGAGDAPVTVSPTGSDAQNVVVWMDHRATGEADAINQGDWDVLRYVGGKISPEMELPKLCWIKKHLPETWANAEKFLDLADFLTYTATGQDVRSLCTNVCKWTYLGHENRWDDEFLTQIGLEDLRRNGARVGDDIRPLGERIGPLTPAAAAHLGLTTNCAVAVGAIDAHAGGLGLLGSALKPQAHLPNHDPFDNAEEADAAQLETFLALIGGTSSCHMAASRNPVFAPGVWGPYFGAMVPGLWLSEGGQSASGALIDYVIEDSSSYADLAYRAESQNTTVHALLNDHVHALARARNLPDPAYLTRDLHVLDYHLGNRSPHADPHARGMVDGLPLDHSLDLDATLYLATVQAVAYGTRAILDALRAQGFSFQTLLATGGGTKNPVWLQTHADATGLPLVLGREPESVLLGAAILAAAAGGAYETVTHAMRALSHAGETITPNPAVRAYHDAKYTVYQSLYQEQKQHRETMSAF